MLRRTIFIFLIVFCLFATVAAAQPPTAARHVLFLNSYHQRMTWVGNMLRAVEDVLQPEANNIILHVENMDTKRVYSEEYFELMAKTYAIKFKNQKLDLILSADNHAFDFLRKYRDTFAPNTPVVFCGVNDYQPEWLNDFPNVTGLEEAVSPRKNVDLILKNHPGTKEIYIINDYLKTGRAWERNIRQKLKNYGNGVKFTYAPNMTLPMLRETIKRLPGSTVVLLGVYFSDAAGRSFTYEAIGEEFTKHSPIPVYAMLAFNVRADVVGGHVISAYSHAAAMAQTGQRVLDGEMAGDLPVRGDGANQYMFDFKALERYGIPLRALPPDSVILNKPVSFYEQHKSIIIGSGFVFATLLLLIALLVRNIFMRRRLTQKLRQSEFKFRAVFEHTSQYMTLTDTSGTVLDANRKALQLAQGEIPLDLPFWDATWFENIRTPAQRVKEVVVQASRGQTTKLELTFAENGEKTREVEATFSPAYDEEGNIVFLIIEGKDITEHKQAQYTLAENARFVEALLTAFPSPVFYKDEKGRYLGCNKAFEDFLGFSLEEIKGKTASDLWPSTRGELFKSKDAELIEAGSGIQSYTHEIKDRLGRDRVILLRKSLFHSALGKTAGLIGAFVDITDIKKSEERIRQLKNNLQTTLDSMPSILVTVDNRGRVEQWNKSAREYCNERCPSGLNKPFTFLMPWLEDNHDAIMNAITNKDHLDGLRVHFQKDGDSVHAYVSVFPLAGGEEDGAVIRIDDVTEREQMEQAMIQSEKMLSVGGLAAGMAHEINNPLGGILQGVQNIFRRLSPKLAANVKVASDKGCELHNITEYMADRRILAMLEGIQESGERAARIVSNMLEFSTPGNERRTTCNITQVMDRALELAESDYTLKDRFNFSTITIIKEYADDITPVVCAPSEMEQVFLNLIKNAGIALLENPDSDTAPTITMRARQEDNEIVAEISDNGPGIDEDIQPRVFEPFYTTRAPGEGTGLGLAVSYFIVTRNHGGQFTLFSPPGKGATFTVRLPIN